MAQTHKLNIQEIQTQQAKILLRSPAQMSEWAECSPLVQGQGLKPQLMPTAGAPTWPPAHSYETGISEQLLKELYHVDLIQTWSYDLTRKEKPSLSWPTSALRVIAVAAMS